MLDAIVELGGKAVARDILARIRRKEPNYVQANLQDFHDRYLITDVIGATVGAGFDITGAVNDTTTWARLGRKDRDDFQRRFDPASRPRDLKGQFTIGV